MARLEAITRGSSVRGILPDGLVTVVDVNWIGTAAIEITYKDSSGRLGNELLYRDREPTLEVASVGQPWSFDGDGAAISVPRLGSWYVGLAAKKVARHASHHARERNFRLCCGTLIPTMTGAQANRLFS
jgi:hypothetical protein